ncbi:MAG: hypothetical protein M0R28_04315 [Pigmentiphaga sp.]|nr:hypothetical protein [Pigmentiphaga sp.]
MTRGHRIGFLQGSLNIQQRSAEDRPDFTSGESQIDRRAALPMEFWLCDARESVVFEGRCGDMDADWWHGFEPLISTWTTFRCRRLYCRRAGTKEP